VEKGVRRILVRGGQCPLAACGEENFDYEMVHSEEYMNKHVVSIAPFSTPAFTPHPHSENCSFCMFSLFNFFYPF